MPWLLQDGNGNQRKAHHAVYSPQQHTLIVFFRVVNAAAAAAQGEGVGTTSIVVQRFIDNTEPLGEGMPSSTGTPLAHPLQAWHHMYAHSMLSGTVRLQGTHNLALC